MSYDKHDITIRLTTEPYAFPYVLWLVAHFGPFPQPNNHIGE
jgi:hypothetical protein